MGRAKKEWIEAQERGWSAPDTHVCAHCLEDLFLQQVVEDNVTEHACSYCERTSSQPIAAPLDEVLPYIAGAFFQYYEEPGAAGLPRDSGEWVGEELITDTQDALLSLGTFADGDLFEDIANSFHDIAWVPAPGGFWLGEHEHDRLIHAWGSFVKTTKHRSRYFFVKPMDPGSETGSTYSPQALLALIGQYIEEFSLWKELFQDTVVYRARKNTAASIGAEFSELCPPPPELATAGRMNPPGISYGYFALDAETAVLEISDAPPATYVLATFSIRNRLLAVDLTGLPEIPSVFNIEMRRERDALIFLHSFVDAISLPVSKDGREHVEYVPSQIVCEYIAQVLRLGNDESPDAILYPSAVDPGHANLVVFPPRSYRDEWSDIVALVRASEVTITTWNDYGSLASRDGRIL
jgi:hypothetical protein